MCILDKSHYSIIYKVKNKLNNQIRAMKEISKANIENVNDTKNIIFSINIFTNLKHSNLIQLNEFYEDDKNFHVLYDVDDKVDYY